MRVGLYIEHGVGNGVGGAELMMAHLASLWSRSNEVDLIHHRPPLTLERLSLFSTDDYSRVTVRPLPREDDAPPLADPFRRYRAAREWHRTVSEGYDLFINCTHWLPCFCRARVGALLVLFPFYVRPGDAPEMRAQPRWKQLRHAAYHDFEWRRRLATYRHRFAISEFTREWTMRRWGVECALLPPPVNLEFEDRPKQPLVLSVGRFSTLAHSKKQLEMMQAFQKLSAGPLDGWTYASVGGLNTRAENHAYFEQVRQAGRNVSTIVEANVDRSRIKDLFERARIFWHATGLGEDPESRPELLEHFGIATVEAMAAGCVPVVINRGGQAEIVEHGVSGFVWNTLDELALFTRTLAEDEALWRRMSAAARIRSQQYSSSRFVERISRACNVALEPEQQRAAAR